MTLTREQVLEQFRMVNDPELHRDLVTLKGAVAPVPRNSGDFGVFCQRW